MTLGERIRATFTPREITFEFDQTQNYTTPGITVRELKDKLRGYVYQDQKKFCDQIDFCGLQLTWSMKYNAYVVCEPRIRQ